MRRISLFALALLLATATAASAAAGISLRWNDCLGDGGVQNLDFACDTNTGSRVLVGSFQLASDLASVNGNELVVDLAASAPALPDWWRFVSIGSCRRTELSIAAHNGANCPDPFGGLASMNIAAYQVALQSANFARLICVNAVVQTDEANLVGGYEYSLARWTITNAKTVGTGSCAGCATPVCIVFHSANITTEVNVNSIKLTEAAAPGSNYVTWQGGGGGGFCPAATPTRNSTWGAVKSLYR